jgi:hypothetical protein
MARRSFVVAVVFDFGGVGFIYLLYFAVLGFELRASWLHTC